MHENREGSKASVDQTDRSGRRKATRRICTQWRNLAVIGPLAMGAVSDALGHPKYGFVLATGFAGLLFAGLLINWIYDPTRELLSQLDKTEYR